MHTVTGVILPGEYMKAFLYKSGTGIANNIASGNTRILLRKTGSCQSPQNIKIQATARMPVFLWSKWRVSEA